MDARVPTICPCQSQPSTDDTEICKKCDGVGTIWIVVPATREEAPYWANLNNLDEPGDSQ